MRSSITLALAVLFSMLLTVADHALAAPISVPNFSFETPVLGDGGSTAAVAGWVTSSTSAQVLIYNSTNGQFTNTTGMPLPAPGDGNNFGLANLTSSGAPRIGSYTSAASLATVESGLYTLTVAVGNRLNLEPGTVTLDFLVDDVVVPSASLSFDGSAEISDDSFEDFTTTFFASGALLGGDLKVRLTHSDIASTTTRTADFDNVRLEFASIPEPSSLMLLGLGALGLVRHTRRRQRVSSK